MNLKEELIKLKTKLTKTGVDNKNCGKATVVKNDLTDEEKELLLAGINIQNKGVAPTANLISKHFQNKKSISLNYKVDEFIDWYYENRVKGQISSIAEYQVTEEMRNFIEKMAVWYELRYPDYEINRLMYCSGQEEKQVSDIMFNQNKYINEQFDENNEVRLINWEQFYNAKSFFNSLPYYEKKFISRPKYSSLVYLDPNYTSSNNGYTVACKTAQLHLTPGGYIELAEGVGIYTNFLVKDDEIKGMHIINFSNLLKDKGIILPENNELDMIINNYLDRCYQKENMLDCVMYRIIERGGKRFGPRRGLLFAKEFKRNIDIPMQYGVDYADPGLREFINEYLKLGGSDSLTCYVGYFPKESENEKLDTITIKELLKIKNKYTEEEKMLHQRLVDSLSNQLNQEVEKEQVKQLKLQNNK